MAFYTEFLELQQTLEVMGHTVLAPTLELEVAGDGVSVGKFVGQQGGADAFPPEHDVWKKKGSAILTHFAKIDASDAVLITNWEKKGQPNYIGANGFLEMGYAFATGKKIYILNDLPAQSPFKEEILGMQPTILHGSIEQIPL